jgi:broad specificity phosphatase PhoE
MSSQTLLFARHGNTFGPGDKVKWVGRETDLPLVEKGLQQAAAAAEAFRRKGLIPDAIYCASLQRTRHFAEIVSDALNICAPVVDGRLDELDYGSWAGRSNDEILAADPGAAAAMEAWNSADVWPAQGAWVSQSETVMAALRDFAGDCLAAGRHERPLVVSSNGILRFLPRLLLEKEAQLPSFKMRTGHLGLIERHNGAARLGTWDTAPEAF